MKFIFLIYCIPLCVFAQTTAPVKEEVPAPATQKVEVKPTSQDSEIQKRLEGILNATGWFTHVSVEVKEGIVFLSGTTKSEEFKSWAGNLARNTQNVVAVVNKITVEESTLEGFGAITQLFQNRWNSLVHSVPSIVIGVAILILAWVLAFLASLITRIALRRRYNKSLLQEVVSKSVGILIFLFGIYLIFDLANLTGAALTVLSGTGLLGIVLGIAFRDITENFLASILLSIHNPFRSGDLVEIAGFTGYVQGLTMRVTLLMSLDGNHIQIPNANVYKSSIRNYTSNPNRREEFTLSIGDEEGISRAQEIALKVLEEHEAVLRDPEPLVLVDGIGKSAIILRIYFWLNGSQFSSLKVKSSVIRLIRQALQAEKIPMPGEVRELWFPKSLSIRMEHPGGGKGESKEPLPRGPNEVATSSESGFQSEAQEIKEQGKQARLPEAGKNLLPPAQNTHNSHE